MERRQASAGANPAAGQWMQPLSVTFLDANRRTEAGVGDGVRQAGAGWQGCQKPAPNGGGHGTMKDGCRRSSAPPPKASMLPRSHRSGCRKKKEKKTGE